MIYVKETFAKELWVFWWGEEPHVDEIARHQGLHGKILFCCIINVKYQGGMKLVKADITTLISC